jgi:hypothetical protein
MPDTPEIFAALGKADRNGTFQSPSPLIRGVTNVLGQM